MSYFGIALYEPKKLENYGTIVRSAHNFGCSFISMIGARFKRQASDTTDAKKHIPIFEYKNLEEFVSSLPKNCEIVRCEVDGQETLKQFNHPKNVVYIFGGEDRSVPTISNAKSVKIETPYCLNLAVTASIFMYDRQLKH